MANSKYDILSNKDSDPVFGCGTFHNLFLSNAICQLDTTIVYDSVSAIGDKLFTINLTKLFQTDLSDDDKAIAASCFDECRYFMSIPDFYDSLFDGSRSIPALLNQLYSLNIIGFYEYSQLLTVSEAINSAINLSIDEYDFYDILNNVRDDIYIQSSGNNQAPILFADAVMDIAIASMEFWDEDMNEPFTGRDEYVPPAVAADVGGAIIGAATNAINQYANSGTVNARGVLIGAGAGAVVASTGGVAKVVSLVCKTAMRVGKFISKLF